MINGFDTATRDMRKEGYLRSRACQILWDDHATTGSLPVKNESLFPKEAELGTLISLRPSRLST